MTEIKNNLLQHNLKSFHIIYKDKHKLKSKNNNIKPVRCFCLNQHRSHGPIFFFQRAPILVLKEGTDTSQGKPQLISNINACQAIVDAVRTTLGPRGMDKLIVDGKGK